MNCSECGGIVAVDQMRCEKCGHDMLAEDIALRPVNHLSIETLPLKPARFAAAEAAPTVALADQLARDRWRLVFVPIGFVVCVVLQWLEHR